MPGHIQPLISPFLTSSKIRLDLVLCENASMIVLTWSDRLAHVVPDTHAAETHATTRVLEISLRLAVSGGLSCTPQDKAELSRSP